MAVKKKSEKRIKKEAYWFRLLDAAGKYKNVMFVDATNVSSKQICMIRKELRAIGAYMIMGKNVSIDSVLIKSKCRQFTNMFAEFWLEYVDVSSI